jgi:hypothetical protein
VSPSTLDDINAKFRNTESSRNENSSLVNHALKNPPPCGGTFTIICGWFESVFGPSVLMVDALPVSRSNA